MMYSAYIYIISCNLKHDKINEGVGIISIKYNNELTTSNLFLSW